MSIEQNNSPLRDYGTFDPLRETSEHINNCLCGTKLSPENILYGLPVAAQLGLPAGSDIRVRRFFVCCPRCGSKGPATKLSIYAVLQWNLSNLCEKPSYTTIPLFGLNGLSKTEATVKMQAVRVDLRQRLDECELRLKDPDVSKHPGPRYHAKLGAYFAWNYYALHLLSENTYFRSNPHGVAGKIDDAADQSTRSS